MSTFAIFMLGFVGGGILEYVFAFLFELIARKPLKIHHRFSLGKKVSLFSLPIWGILAILFMRGMQSYVLLFGASAVVGTLFEGLLGKFIKRFFGVRVWTYKYGALGNFTSIYALPYWGAAGIVFAVLGRIFGV